MTHGTQTLSAGAMWTLSTRSGKWGHVALAVSILLVAACSTMPPTHDVDPLAESPPAYSLVFIIHGDADYGYHDAAGTARRADEVVLAKAQAVAEQNPDAEVFIFHEIERRHILFLFPRRDGRAYYYRHGRLQAEESYWRDQGDSRFAPEVRFHEQFAGGGTHSPLRILLYFGHELPEFNGAGYDASYKKRSVTVGDLAQGVREFAGEAAKLDLLVLSTCFGGTPHTIGALAPFARYIVASPDNLHLSHFDLESLAGLDVGAGEGDLAAFAGAFAHHAFGRLAEEVQTVVSVVVYDTEHVGAFVASVSEAYGRTLAAAPDMSPASIERCDCADDPAYATPDMSEGLTVLYRAPRFGRLKLKHTHSGWECWSFAAPAAGHAAGARP